MVGVSDDCCGSRRSGGFAKTLLARSPNTLQPCGSIELWLCGSVLVSGLVEVGHVVPF